MIIAITAVGAGNVPSHAVHLFYLLSYHREVRLKWSFLAGVSVAPDQRRSRFETHVVADAQKGTPVAVA